MTKKQILTEEYNDILECLARVNSELTDLCTEISDVNDVDALEAMTKEVYEAKIIRINDLEEQMRKLNKEALETKKKLKAIDAVESLKADKTEEYPDAVKNFEELAKKLEDNNAKMKTVTKIKLGVTAVLAFAAGYAIGGYRGYQLRSGDWTDDLD